MSKGVSAMESVAPDVVLIIEGMMCQKNCANTVRDALIGVTGVKDAVVTFASKDAKIWLNDPTVELTDLVDAVEVVGYDVVQKQDHRPPHDQRADETQKNSTKGLVADVTLFVQGMDSVRDLLRVEETLQSMEGVQRVDIFASKQVVDLYGLVDAEIAINVLRSKGFVSSLSKISTTTLTDIDLSSHSTFNPLQPVSQPQPQQALGHKLQAFLILDLTKLRKIHDVQKVAETLSRVAGIDTHVDFAHNALIIYYNDSRMSRQHVVDILAEKKLAAFIQSTTSSLSTANNTTSTLDDSSHHSRTGGRREYIYQLGGMSCGACAAKIEKSWSSMPGVVESAVSVMTHQGRAVIDDSLNGAKGPRDLLEKAKSMGYECTLLTSADGSSASPLMGASGAVEDVQAQEVEQWRRMLIISLVFGVPVLILHFGGHLSMMFMEWLDQPALCGEGIQLGQLLMLSFNIPILLFVGMKFYRNAIIGAMHSNFGMDFLVTVGTSITFIYSLFELGIACATGESTTHVFFETTGMLLMFVTIGKFIEAYAKGKSASSIAELLKLQPTEAFLVTGTSLERILNPSETSPLINDEEVRNIDVQLVQRGDVVKVFPGGRIPTDGVIVLGRSHVDESMMTGESIPVAKHKGDTVFGSTVNQDSCIYVSVTSYGSQSALAQIVRLVEKAQMNKAPIQDYADKMAGLFTPVILVIATLTFIIWLSLAESGVVPRSWFADEYNDPVLFSLLFSISVVVISCPCALGLATPTAIMVGTAVGAQNGVLIKGGSAFEVAHKVDTIIFDKTGTLTEGKPSVTDVVPLEQKMNGVMSTPSVTALMTLAATAEQQSEHPLALAIMQSAREKFKVSPMPLAEHATVSFVGSGVSCECSLGHILVGNRTFMKTQGVNFSSVADSAMWTLETQGKTAICVAVDKDIQGVLGICDEVKPEAVQTIRSLRKLGLDVWMLTGDNPTTAEALANKVDIPQDHVMAGMFPRDKARKVKELQAQGHVVAMVGDGVNDSPALAQAQLGVAIGAGTQIAIEAASMVLIRSDLHDLVVAFDLAQVVFRRIKWNFLWAVLYNFVSIPLAAGLWYPWTHMSLPPHYAGLAMALSSISVVISSSLLKFYKRPDEHQRAQRKTRNNRVEYDSLPAESSHNELEMGAFRKPRSESF